MRYLKHVVIILVVIFSVNIAWAYSSQMTPTMSERLSQPMALSGVCSDVMIVEWRGGAGPTKTALKSLKNHCESSMKAFPKFIKERGYAMRSRGKMNTSICLMPVNSEPRNLNDVNYRFSTRSKTYDKDGNVEQIWGYFQRYTNYIYLRNSAVNIHKVVFVHELFHAASYYYGIYEQHTGNKDLAEEQLAQDFTAYLGYGR